MNARYNQFNSKNQASFHFPSELIVDCFAGGGGASIGIEMATGKPIDHAINHDPQAIAMHHYNHPHTKHWCESVWDVDPLEVTNGQQVGLLWASPDCKHFSKAKGSKPVEKKIRGLAWIVLRWIAKAKPRVIILENVEEFVTWGRIVNGKPCPKRKGETFRSFINAIRRNGYQVEYRELRACDYGAPTTRKRFFMIARCDGLPIVWPEPTHGQSNSEEVQSGKLKPWRAAAEIIDWSIPCKSIFGRKKPLAENTMRRIAKGLEKFVINDPEPFIVSYYGNKKPNEFRGLSLDKSLPTQTTENRFALVTPYITRIGQTGFGGNKMSYSFKSPITTVTTKAEHLLLVPYFVPRYGERTGQTPRCNSSQEPCKTVTATANNGNLVTAFLAKHYSGVIGQDTKSPCSTVTSIDHHSLVTSQLIKLRNNNYGSSIKLPLPTITSGGNHIGEVRAFLLKYYGTNIGTSCKEPVQTLTTKHRFGLVTIHGQDYQIIDIGMRMLEPHELYAAQGFPDFYEHAIEYNGKRLSKAAQVRMCGNSVCPDLAKALVSANYKEQTDWFSKTNLKRTLNSRN